MLHYKIRVHFDSPGYIANPYWPEQYQLIEITKKSGANRARSSANARKALEEHLSSIGMSFADYERLQTRAARPFRREDDSGDNGSGCIIIAHVDSFLVHVASVVRAAQRPCPPEQVRSVMRIEPWLTDKVEPDGIWERYVVVSAGTGAKLSNQRGLRTSSYIRDFDAEGQVDIDQAYVKPSVLEQAIRWGGSNLGIGASRKMGWGRFTLTKWYEIE